MPIAADFVTFSDFSFDLSIGQDIDRTLSENIPEAPRSGEGALLTWNVRREGSGSVQYEVVVNNGSAQSFSVSGTDWHSLQEVIGTGRIQQGNNTVTYRVTGGNGRLSIGDVTLWYRKNV
jgi:hypothetical protein